MGIIIFFTLIFLGILIIAKFLESKLRSAPQQVFKLSFKKKLYFFSIAERKFYDVLKEVAHELNYELFAKVRWADIIYSNSKGKEWWSNWGRIKSKHVDFLLCEKHDYTPAIIIQLDDSSHSRQDRVNRDNFEAETLKLAGLKLVRFKVQQDYLKEEIRARIC